MRKRCCLRGATLALWIAWLLPAAPTGAATISNWPATSFSGGFGEPTPSLAPTVNPYTGQTFTAPNGTLDSLRIALEGDSPKIGNQGDTVFHVLITEFAGSAGGQDFHPTTTCHATAGVCFESGDLVVPLLAGVIEFVVPLGGLALNPGQEYFFLLDAEVTADGVGSSVGVGRRSGGPGIARSRQISGDPSNATRDDHFAGSWNVTATGDIAFELSYTPVPEPASAGLCAGGLAALAAARRARRTPATR